MFHYHDPTLSPVAPLWYVQRLLEHATSRSRTAKKRAASCPHPYAGSINTTLLVSNIKLILLNRILARMTMLDNLANLFPLLGQVGIT